MKKSRILAALAAAAMAVSALAAIPASAAAEYHAYIGVQEPTTWRFRNAWNDPTYGKDSGYFDELHQNGTDPAGGSFDDAAISADGTYSVKANLDWSDVEAFSLLFVSTDIPLSDSISITDVKVKIDGTTKYTFDEYYQNPDDKEYVSILCINQWNNELTAEHEFGYVMPSSSVEIEFTISGVPAGDAPAAEPAAEAPAADSDSASAGTGNMPAAAAVTVMVVAGAAAVASRKRK